MPLGEVANIQNGYAFKSNLFRQEGLPIIRITNIQASSVDTLSLVYFDANDYNVKLDNFKFYPDEIVIALSGATTGKSGKNKTSKTFYLNQRTAKIVPKDNKILNGYLYHFIQLSSNYFYELAGGGAQPNLSTEQLKKIKIPVPPLAEQERIVGILDQFDALVNDMSQGLPAEIEGRKKQYEYYRNKLLTFPQAV